MPAAVPDIVPVLGPVVGQWHNLGRHAVVLRVCTCVAQLGYVSSPRE